MLWSKRASGCGAAAPAERTSRGTESTGRWERCWTPAVERGGENEELLQKMLNECAAGRGEVGTQSCGQEGKRDKGKEVQATRVKSFVIAFGGKGGK